MTNDTPTSRLYEELLDNPPHDHTFILSDYSDDEVRSLRSELESSTDDWDRILVKLISSLLGE